MRRSHPFPALLALLSSACAFEVPTEPLGVLAEPPSASGPGRLVIDLADGTTLEQARAITGYQTLTWVSERSADEALASIEVPELALALSRLAGLPGVESAEPSVEVTAFGFPDDPLYDQQWNFALIGAPAGWRVGGGAGVVVAVIDTGVSPVADLADTLLLEGYSFVPGVASSADDNGHGTHVAGTIAQSTDNGLGVAGVAPQATLLPLKVLSAQGSGRSEWIASAIDEAADQGAQIINLSLGGGASSVIATAVQKAQARGVLVVAAAGNSGRSGVSSPANLPGVLAVSAVGPSDALAPYSSFGPEVGISAPGGDTRVPGGGVLQDTIAADGHAFREFQGTSMATPHVAAAAAVLWGAGAGDAEAVKALLMGAAVDLGEAGRDPKYGAGRLDLSAAVRTLTLQARAPLFGLGLLAAALVTRMAKGVPAGWRLMALLSAATTAGGLFFLPWLPLPPSLALDLLSRPLLLWPERLLGDPVGRFPLLLSALVPMVLTFFLGPTRTFGALVAGVSIGAAVHFFYGAVTGSLVPWGLSGAMGGVWLGLQGAVCVVCALAATGIARSREAK